MQREDFGNYLQINKRHWDAIAQRDWAKKADLRTPIRDGDPFLEMMEPKLSHYLRGINGKKLIVLQFGDGLLMLACAKSGATVTGVDFCKKQVLLARKAPRFVVLM